MNLEKELIKSGVRFDKRGLLERRPSVIHELESGDVFVTSPGAKIIISSQLTKTSPYLDKPHRGILKVYGNDCYRHKIREIYKRCVDLESLCIEYGKEVFVLHLKIRVLEGDGLLIEQVVDGINRALKMRKIPVRGYPKAICYTFCFDRIVADPLEAETEMEIIVVRMNDIVLLVEASRGECDFEALTRCVQLSIKENQASSN